MQVILITQVKYYLLHKDEFTFTAKTKKNKTVGMNNGCKSKICMGSMEEKEILEGLFLS